MRDMNNYFFFFFQAEDGIRDLTVTGVQTCALPILMPAIIRTSDKPYRWKIGVAPLDKIANVEKMLPRNYITADGFGITAKARAYLAPLIRGEDFPPFKDGMPQYVRLKNAAVP